MPWLLTAALAIALADLMISLGLRGLLAGRAAARAIAVAGLAWIAAAGAARAADDPVAFGLKATLDTRLAYVVTGNGEVDNTSRAGLRGLTVVLNRRTAVEAADPIAVNVETDELSFFPILYWPVVDQQGGLSPAAIAKVNAYLHTGGTVLFDTRDEGASLGDPRGSAGTRRLQQLVRGIDIPPVGPTPPDHVLTKSFYLMQEFPGRYTGGALWVENRENAADEVSSVIIGSNDYAGAWAIDDSNRPMYPVTPGGEQQREWAYRFGVNLIMYALTGNYKSDQVHVPSILERLGQ